MTLKHFSMLNEMKMIILTQIQARNIEESNNEIDCCIKVLNVLSKIFEYIINKRIKYQPIIIQKMYSCSQDQEFNAQKQFSQVGKLKKGSYCMIKNQPCKIIEISFAKTGKHGASKAAITGLNIFTDKKLQCSMPSEKDIEIPIVSKHQEQVASVNEQNKTIDLVLKDGTLKGIKFPRSQELLQRLVNLWEQSQQNNSILYLTWIEACNIERIVSVRLAKKKNF